MTTETTPPLRPEDFTDVDREMLMLAMLSYRGFQDVSLPLPDATLLHAAIARGLTSLPLLEGRWEIVWGPVSHSLGVFDSSLMYVVRGTKEPKRYVVVIRGTNPVSALDWLLGDFWAGRQLPWSYGTDTPADAKVSFSTALGLDVLRHMRSTGVPGGIAADLWRFIDEDVGGQLRKAGDYLLRPLRDTIEPLVTGLRTDIRGLLDDVREQERALTRLIKPDLEGRVRKLLDKRASDRKLLDVVAGIAHAGGERPALDLLRLIEGDSWIRNQFGRGQDILSFLKAAVAHAKGPIDVTVTGHSKGGALAPTVALWLADTQGTAGVPDAAQWDPRSDSVVRCYSYAGPTAGNAAFAAHSNAKLRARCARIWNTHDVVPHAWVAADVRQIPDLYGDAVHRIPGFAELADEICHDMANVGIKYQQIEQSRPFTTAVDPNRPLFVDQFTYQHAEAYLVGLGCPVTKIDTFFNPLA